MKRDKPTYEVRFPNLPKGFKELTTVEEQIRMIARRMIARRIKLHKEKK